MLSDKERLAKLEALAETNISSIRMLIKTNDKQNQTITSETRALTESYHALKDATNECRRNREDMDRRMGEKRAALVDLDRQVQSKADKISLEKVDRKLDALKDDINKAIRNMLIKTVAIILTATGLIIAGYLKSKGVL